ncbi:antirestriction protein ArdA [uncultured Arsenicicoccus sp.]|uniref:antirestriction protein ArdA n=1 Tax=uncultured Arsenicicoccus sp. TaxID=491339 RepID=UPI0025984109|nr:antirestriction protein ArdA [uncultured Arsenicicoccus sp.]
MSGTPLSDSYRHRPPSLPADVAELSWMREHRRTGAWTDAALASDLAAHGRVGAALCHVIGEHLEPEAESPLGEFVIYDILDPHAVLDQLPTLRPCGHAAWIEALRAFCATAIRVGWGGREAELQPRPMLYVARSACSVGDWIDMTRPERQVEQALGSLPGDPTDTDWQVHGRMGFHHVYPMAQPELWTMNAVAQGIDRHGEAYAAYAEMTFQQGMSEHDFEARYRGHVSTLEEFVFDQAESRGWLAALAALNRVDGLAGALSLDMAVLTRQVFSSGYSYEPGADGYHIFGPPDLS